MKAENNKSKKSQYQTPVLKKVGKISSLTLKNGSVSDGLAPRTP